MSGWGLRILVNFGVTYASWKASSEFRSTSWWSLRRSGRRPCHVGPKSGSTPVMPLACGRLHDYTMISPDNFTYFTSDIEFACRSGLVWGRCLQARCNLRDLQSSALTRTSSICGDQKCAVIVSFRGHPFYEQIYHICSLFPAACPTSM